MGNSFAKHYYSDIFLSCLQALAHVSTQYVRARCMRSACVNVFHAPYFNSCRQNGNRPMWCLSPATTNTHQHFLTNAQIRFCVVFYLSMLSLCNRQTLVCCQKKKKEEKKKKYIVALWMPRRRMLECAVNNVEKQILLSACEW